MNLVHGIKATIAKMEEIDRERDAKIKDLEDGLKALRKINTVCEMCYGDGRVLRKRACAEDDRPDPNLPEDMIRCTSCKGTGKAK